MGKNYLLQDSPPAWTQEAYCPPRSKCSLCWSVGGGGTPQPGMGYPPTWDGVPPPTWDGVPPWTWDGVHLPRIWDGVPPWPDLGWGTPLPRLGCELTNKLKTVPSPILRMRAVINHEWSTSLGKVFHTHPSPCQVGRGPHPSPPTWKDQAGRRSSYPKKNQAGRTNHERALPSQPVGIGMGRCVCLVVLMGGCFVNDKFTWMPQQPFFPQEFARDCAQCDTQSHLLHPLLNRPHNCHLLYLHLKCAQGNTSPSVLN